MQTALQDDFVRTRRQFRIVTAVAILVIVAGMVFYHLVEKMNWVDALYFCTITLTTIGYGDITPHTTAGKLFTVGYVFSGIGIIAAFANLALRRAVAGQLKRTKKR